MMQLAHMSWVPVYSMLAFVVVLLYLWQLSHVLLVDVVMAEVGDSDIGSKACSVLRGRRVTVWCVGGGTCRSWWSAAHLLYCLEEERRKKDPRAPTDRDPFKIETVRAHAYTVGCCRHQQHTAHGLPALKIHGNGRHYRLCRKAGAKSRCCCLMFPCKGVGCVCPLSPACPLACFSC